jgi:F0F1-type ATP synthase assembly protein I
MVENKRESSGKQDESSIRGFGQAYRKAMPFINGFYVMAAATALMGWLGWQADAWLATKPILFIVGLFLGLGVGFYHMIRLLSKIED